MTPDPENGIRLRSANPADCPRLSVVAQAAKAHWGYPAEWLEAWREELTFEPADLQSQQVTVAEAGGQVLGLSALLLEGDQAEIEHLWVDPEAHGRGVGRQLLEALISAARAQGARRVEILSDPYAVGFYERMGARRIGEQTSDLFGSPRTLPVYEITL